MTSKDISAAFAKQAKCRKHDRKGRVKSYRYIKTKDRREMDLKKYAQAEAVKLNWLQKAKSDGMTVNEYLSKTRTTTDFKILSQLARALPSFRGFGGMPLTGFQRNTIAAAATQRLRTLGLIGNEEVQKEFPS